MPISIFMRPSLTVTDNKRVLRIITRLNVGGPAIQALMLTRRLDRFPTTLIAGQAPVEEGELFDVNVSVTYAPLVRSVNPLQDAAAYIAVRKVIRDRRPRIVHTHMAKAGTIGRLAAGRDGIRTVHTFHGHVLEGYFSSPVEKFFVRTERYLAAHTDALIAVSEEVRDALLDLGIGSSERFHVIPLGLELDRFLQIDNRAGTFRRDLGVSDRTPLVAVLGRVTRIKDHGTLLRSIASLSDVHLAVLGDGDKRTEVEQMARDLGINQRVHFVGWRRDLEAVFSDVDAVALTSLNEGTPVSLIEASASARPVVATDVGGVRSVVEDGVTGLLVPVRDHAAVADAIRRLFDDRALARVLGQKGREHVRERFSHERLLTDIASLYDDLLTPRA